MLQLDPDATLAQARDAYRVLVRSNHPDLVGSDGNETMILLNQAMAALEAGEAEPADHSAVPNGVDGMDGADGGHAELVVLDDGLTLNAPSDELFARLAAAMDEVGDLTYADASSGYLEAAVAMGNSSPSQLVVSLQGRGEHTEAFFTLESMGVETPPDLGEVVQAIGAVLARESGNSA